VSERHILVIGKTGQLAQALSRDSCVIGLGRDQLDLSWPTKRIETVLTGILSQADETTLRAFSGVINAAAYTAVDAAEDDLETARAVNAAAVDAIARSCAKAGLPLVHISTDYVFDGFASSPYPPDHPTNPINVYGETKREGETALLESGVDQFAILRTSWVYDASGKNFMNTMLRLAETRDSLQVVDDQYGRPTFADDLADACFAAIRGLAAGRPSGIYHVTNTGPIISWADFARAIFDMAGLSIAVKGIPSSSYPTPAKRPAYSAMDTQSFETVFSHDLPDWREALARAMRARQT